MVINPHQKLGHLQRIQNLLTFRHPIMKHLLLVLTQRFELGHEHQALADVVANLSYLVPPLHDFAALDWRNVQLLHQYAGNGIALGLEEELIRLAAGPEGHLGDGRGGGESVGIKKNKHRR